MDKIIEDALARQKENFKFELEMVMMRMKKEHDQQIQALSNQLGESNCRNITYQAGSDSDADEYLKADNHPIDQNTGGGPTEDNNTGGDSIKDNNAGDSRVVPLRNHPKHDIDKDEKMKDLKSKINALISAPEVKKTGISCPYLREWESILYPAKFNLINFTPFDGKGSPTQHLIYFKSHLGVISGNKPLKVRPFVSTIHRPTFDWYRRLKPGSVNSWDDMKSSFLGNFFDDDAKISIRTLFEEKQEDEEAVNDFIKRFRNKAMNCRDPVIKDFILQTCHNNLSIDILKVMGVAPSNT
uniref:Retrotransposon gag domain-containing protein n=1 Tax=Asparagus officinalis TaxID=4686 RepID=Q2AA65_ASPOF|nr:hypothetical protein 18.t00005 [Asparagus officinalis]